MIGNTPIVELHHCTAGARVYLKMEQFNPGGSLKDRTALGMILDAEKQDVLRPESKMIESTSGNTGIGLSMLSCECGYEVTTICDRYLPASKRARLRALGANILYLPPTPKGMDTVELRIAVANYIATHCPNAVSLGQYSNPANPRIHFETTGPEIWDAMDGKIDAVAVAVGTCGTITGVGRFLKERNPLIQVIGVEPEGSIIFGGVDKPYEIQGGGLSFVPSVLDRSVIDRGLKVPDALAIRAIHDLAQKEGWMVGGTGGLVVHVLQLLAAEFGPGHNLVGIIPDGGERYIDSLYTEQRLARSHRRTESRSCSSEFAEAAQAIGCSLNTYADDSSTGLDDLCRCVGIAVPPVVALSHNEEMIQ
jgi:cystathionine beta-synthase